MALPAIIGAGFVAISAAPTVIEAIEKALEIAERSILFEVANLTDEHLRVEGSHHDSGGFQTPPPPDIAPRTSVVFSCRSTSPGSGAVGNLRLVAPGVWLGMSWHNPFIGSNEFRSSENGERASEFETFATAGSGNRAKFTYVVAYRDHARVGRLVQADWRCCRHCLSLYYNGFPQNGRCANGGEHDAGGSWDFVLPHGVATSSNLQNDWRSCRHCLSLYYNGFPQNGRCANGGEHDAGGSWDYVLPHV
jgi:hypothetical protein